MSAHDIWLASLLFPRTYVNHGPWPCSLLLIKYFLSELERFVSLVKVIDAVVLRFYSFCSWRTVLRNESPVSNYTRIICFSILYIILYTLNIFEFIFYLFFIYFCNAFNGAISASRHRQACIYTTSPSILAKIEFKFDHQQSALLAWTNKGQTSSFVM